MAGKSHGTRTGVPLGSQTRNAMLSARNASRARAGGHRDSPIGLASSAPAGGEAVTASPGEATTQSSQPVVYGPSPIRGDAESATPALDSHPAYDYVVRAHHRRR